MAMAVTVGGHLISQMNICHRNHGHARDSRWCSTITALGLYPVADLRLLGGRFVLQVMFHTLDGYLYVFRQESVQYQPSGEGGTRSPRATPHYLQNPKWPPGGPKMADGVWKGVFLLRFLGVLSNFR